MLSLLVGTVEAKTLKICEFCLDGGEAARLELKEYCIVERDSLDTPKVDVGLTEDTMLSFVSAICMHSTHCNSHSTFKHEIQNNYGTYQSLQKGVQPVLHATSDLIF